MLGLSFYVNLVFQRSVLTVQFLSFIDLETENLEKPFGYEIDIREKTDFGVSGNDNKVPFYLTGWSSGSCL